MTKRVAVKCRSSRAWVRLLHALFAMLVIAWGLPARAANCSAAASPGTAPPSWQTYCWLDFSIYDDVAARSAAGQTVSYTLTDGSVLSFNVKATSSAATALRSIAAPSWTGAAVGNTAFLGIPGQPVLYTLNPGTVTLTFSGILITPPPGAPSITAYMFVAADAESTDNTEALQFVTNKNTWVVLDKVDPISGTQYPPATGEFTNTFTETGGGLQGNVGGYIVGANSPTQVTTTFTAGGLQGAMFAVRFASMRLAKVIGGARADPSDQFNFTVKGTSTGTTLATGSTSGTGSGPFNANAVSLASGLPLTLSETVATGSASTFAAYQTLFSCVNGTSGSTTSLPNGVATTSYDFGSLQFGDAISCTFTNTAYPRVKLSKALAGTRAFAADQFTVSLTNGATTVATATTTGSGAAVVGGSIPSTQLAAATVYGLNEAATGTTNLNYYTATMACTNAATSSATPLPTTVPATITPAMGDVVTCTITNSPKAATATLTMTKTSIIMSDPVNGTTNPKAIPGAVVQYTIAVTNTGRAAVDLSSIVITDPLPAAPLKQVALRVSAPVVTYADGVVASGLGASPTLNVAYSSTSGGGAPFAATPVADANGYDSAITGLRIQPTGTMAGATAAGQPSFSVSFLIRIN